ncbi:MAG TPA: segregation/condensation protein A [Saprospiraceae bacterium]|nr:segregation/condensation protein A [Saprospiraceae bacterium]
MENYTIKLQQFEGPFDLLLFFIERDELDIYDIPISQITEEFLSYIRQAEELNLDLASEFILVAATLIRIKAKMLIPRRELDENNNEIDPRKELVQKLLEYKAVKEAINELSRMEDDQYFRLNRGNLQSEFNALAQKALVDAEWDSLNLFHLMKTFQKLMDRFNTTPTLVHKIYNYEYTIGEQQEKIFDILKKKSKATFEELFEDCENRVHAIITFLAMLELINLQKLRLIKGNHLNQFWLEERPESEQDETLSSEQQSTASTEEE